MRLIDKLIIVSEEIKNENRRRVTFPIGRPWGHHKVKYILGNPGKLPQECSGSFRETENDRVTEDGVER